MQKVVRLVLLIVGIILIGYGIYTLVTPETSISVGTMRVETQDNTDSYITIALGLVSAAISFLGGRK